MLLSAGARVRDSARSLVSNRSSEGALKLVRNQQIADGGIRHVMRSFLAENHASKCRVSARSGQYILCSHCNAPSASLCAVTQRQRLLSVNHLETSRWSFERVEEALSFWSMERQQSCQKRQHLLFFF